VGILTVQEFVGRYPKEGEKNIYQEGSPQEGGGKGAQPLFFILSGTLERDTCITPLAEKNRISHRGEEAVSSGGGERLSYEGGRGK